MWSLADGVKDAMFLSHYQPSEDYCDFMNDLGKDSNHIRGFPSFFPVKRTSVSHAEFILLIVRFLLIPHRPSPFSTSLSAGETGDDSATLRKRSQDQVHAKIITGFLGRTTYDLLFDEHVQGIRPTRSGPSQAQLSSPHAIFSSAASLAEISSRSLWQLRLPLWHYSNQPKAGLSSGTVGSVGLAFLYSHRGGLVGEFTSRAPILTNYRQLSQVNPVNRSIVYLFQMIEFSLSEQLEPETRLGMLT
ncbi:hypothetical protein CROQUDRAFT_95201 [Cronartium quercuum f. sp. fusiforme G11]|uniref:Uncharacterized protein n=1 Tax=Cronartium quercuum f. sp. fusiforme G11 TaxID=708437 RepID=A0A9P6NHN8_9BASI|nr:hypothetical protein CROQUDRAFT_95201 [Cronartium quercuum f. sp. fusiforme G11]